MKRWILLALAVALEASGADLAGLWEAKLRFGPDLRGPLTIERTGDGWRAELAGVAGVAKEGLALLSNNAFSILDYRAPAGFGVVQHLHHREDEVLHLVEGRIAVWMPNRCLTMSPGDLVFLPKGVELAWSAYGEQPVRMNVTISPGGFEHFFPTIQARGLAAHSRSINRSLRRVRHKGFGACVYRKFDSA